jgi:hypothetical protein
VDDISQCQFYIRDLQYYIKFCRPSLVFGLDFLESKGKILEKKISFQGNMVSLKKLTSVNDNSNLELNLSKDKLNELIDTKTLINLIKNEVINISTQFSTSSYNENFYISRSLSLFTKIKT